MLKIKTLLLTYRYALKVYIFILISLSVVGFTITSFANSNESAIDHPTLSAFHNNEKTTLPIIIQLNNWQHATSPSTHPNSRERQLGSAITQLIHSRKLRNNHASSSTPPEQAIKHFEYSPLVAATVTREELLTLINDPSITVFEDKLKKPLLSQSVSRVYANRNASPYHGNNEWAVAVLDTGVDKNHAFLSNKVIAEACYSDGGGQLGTDSLCPGGVVATTANNSALPCTLDGCDHGTQVAGIAAGNGSSFDGVARDAKIIAINVYSQVNDETFCFPDTTCIGAYTSDIIKGLERVYALRNTHKIAAANVSLGSSELFSGTCDNQPEKHIIDLLKGAKIAVTAATGNGGNTSQMNSPACISSAIAVAATADNSDLPWSGNNTSNALDIFAPGVSITSSSRNGGFITDTGTSLAAPHIAGAWAVIRHANSSLSVDAVTALMQRHGPIVTQNSVSRRRLNLTAMLNELYPPNPPSPPPPNRPINKETSFLPAILQILLD